MHTSPHSMEGHRQNSISRGKAAWHDGNLVLAVGVRLRAASRKQDEASMALN